MYEWVFAFLENNATSFVTSIIAIVVIYLLYRMMGRVITQTSEKIELEAHVVNGLRLLLRVITIVVASTTLFTIFDLPTDLFIGASALFGAALGFGSSQTINNVVAGFYVLFSQPFKVKDYVLIGKLEGQVEEISINYTNLYTPTFNMLKVPNTQVMNNRILNLTHEGFIKYTFTLSFNHDLTVDQMMNQVIRPALAEFFKEKGNGVLRAPEAFLDNSSRQEKRYLFRMFVPKGEAKLLYTLQPELISYVMRKYEQVKTELAS